MESPFVTKTDIIFVKDDTRCFKYVLGHNHPRLELCFTTRLPRIAVKEPALVQQLDLTAVFFIIGFHQLMAEPLRQGYHSSNNLCRLAYGGMSLKVQLTECFLLPLRTTALVEPVAPESQLAGRLEDSSSVLAQKQKPAPVY